MKWSGEIAIIYALYGFPDTMISPQWYLLLFQGCFSPSTATSLWWSCCIIVSYFPGSNGLRDSWRDSSVLERYVPGSLLPAFLFRVSSMNKVSAGSLLVSLTGLLW